MIETTLQFIQSVLLPLGAWGVFCASFLEEIIAPIPSALVLSLSGFLFLKGAFSLSFIATLFFIVVLPASLGVTIGSLFVYTLAHIFGKPILIKWGKWLGLFWNDIEKLQKNFDNKKTDELTLFLLRTIPIIPSVAISAFYGLIRFDLKKYFIYTFLGTCIRSTILAVIGWQMGAFYYKYADVISHIENAIFVLIILAVFIFLVYKIHKKKSI
ncbi:membrane-associated protein [Candidatus Parcubacteria bacterium]|nr:membrane-associated protein [Candidatus Parcubacteria bacterium]